MSSCERKKVWVNEVRISTVLSFTLRTSKDTPTVIVPKESTSVLSNSVMYTYIQYVWFTK